MEVSHHTKTALTRTAGQNRGQRYIHYHGLCNFNTFIPLGPFKQDEIHKVFEYFVKFGGVRGQNVTTNGLEVSIEYRFWNARDYSEIIHQEHALFDNELEISWFKKAKSGNLEHVLPDERMRKGKFFMTRKNSTNTRFAHVPTVFTFFRKICLPKNRHFK